MRNLLFYTLILCLNTSIFAQLPSSISKHTNEIATTEGHLEIINEAEAILTIKKRFIILNEQSRANLFHVNYDPDNKIMSIDADIYDLEGNQIRKVKKSEIRDVLAVGGGSIYTESRIRWIELNYPQYPYVVEFNYKQKIKGISYAALPNWYFQDRKTTRVEKSTFTLTTLNDLDVHYKMYNLNLEPVIKRGDETITYTWSVADIPSFGYEPYSPPSHRLLPILRLSPSQFKINKHEGSMETWENYGTFLYDLWDGRETIPDPLSKEIQTIIAAADNDKEKIRLLYKFMQENMRYVSVQLGIGGWQPFTASHVNEHGYGDCKALSNYMKAMLNDIGLESYPVIISAGSHHPYEVEDDFVDPAFNHAILYIPEEDMWLECTSSFAPPGYLGSFCNDRKVLLVTPEGGQLARTPKLSTAENIAQEQSLITLNADGSALITYQGDFTGILHEKWRHRLNTSSEEDLENEVREQGALPNIKFESLTVTDDPLNPLSSIKYSASASRYASKAGKRLFVPLNLICPQQYVPDASEDRKNPVVIPYGYTKNATIVFTIPEGYRIESLPKNIALDSPFGSYKLTISQNENQVTLERKLLLLDEERPAEDYEALRSFFLDIEKYDGAKMVLVNAS